MLCVRFVLLFLVLAFFVVALLGTVTLPLYTQKIDNYNQSGKVVVTLWSMQIEKVDLSGPNQTTAPSAEPVRINYANCEEFRSVFRAYEAFAISGTVFGFYAFLISCMQCFFRLKVKLPLFILLLLATISELVCVIIGVTVKSAAFCDSANIGENVSAVVFKGNGYNLDVAYFMQVVAFAGYLICSVLAPFSQQLWCGKS